jgi:molecular chaperone GrpE
VRFANESLLQRLLPVLDSFEMALAAANNPQSNTADALKTGVDMIQNQLRTILTDAGLEEIDAAGKPFDPNWHEAVSQLPSAEVPEGQVLQQIRKGFKLNERLIRPASVVVAKKPA